jgi:hypothetical protein
VIEVRMVSEPMTAACRRCGFRTTPSLLQPSLPTIDGATLDIIEGRGHDLPPALRLRLATLVAR